jgi:hypothetical protein
MVSYGSDSAWRMAGSGTEQGAPNLGILDLPEQ